MALFPKSRARIRRQASQWVVRLSGEASVEDHAAFRRWRALDARHSEAYDQMAAIWSQAGRLSRPPAAEVGPSNAPTGQARAPRFALAASLAAAVIATGTMLGSRWLPGPPPAQQMMLFAAAVGEVRTIELPDGSRVILDSDSTVQARFADTERKLMLRNGRARFEVAHEGRPFIVRAGSSEVVATGTRFDVSLIGGLTSVVLLQGSIEVRAVAVQEAGTARPQRLEPGQKLIVRGSAPAERRVAARSDASWPSRMLEFDKTRLDEAAFLANRYSKVQLRLGDERVRGLRVTGAFRAGDTAGLAQSLAKAFNLRIIRQPDGSLLLVDPNRSGRQSD